MRRTLWRVWTACMIALVILMVLFYFSIQSKAVNINLVDDTTQTISAFRPLPGYFTDIIIAVPDSELRLSWLAHHQKQISEGNCTSQYGTYCIDVTDFPFIVLLSGENGEESILSPYLMTHSQPGEIVFHLQSNEAGFVSTESIAYSAGWPKWRMTLHDIHEDFAGSEAKLRVLPPLRLSPFSMSDPNYRWLGWLFFWPLWLTVLVLWAGIMEFVFWLRKRRKA